MTNRVFSCSIEDRFKRRRIKITSFYGFNVHAQSYYGLDKSALLDFCGVAQPRLMVVMDGLQLSKDIKKVAPNCRVVHRHNWTGGKMDYLLAMLTGRPDPSSAQIKDAATQVIDHYRETIDAGLACYVDNESALTPYNAEFYYEVMRLGTQVGGQMCVGNFSHGTPGENQYSLLDDSIQFAMYSNGMHSIGVHEYIIDYPTKYYPHLIGRVKLLIDRSLQIYDGDASMPPAWIDVTEAGWDDVVLPDGTEDGARGIIDTMDLLWKVGHTEGENRAYDQLMEVHDIYKPYGVIRGAALFCLGAVTQRWPTYDFQKTPTLVKNLKNTVYEETQESSMTEITITHDYDQYGGLNFRAEPRLDASRVGKLLSGSTLLTDYTTTEADGYRWMQAQYGTQMGWFAFEGGGGFQVNILPYPAEDTFISALREVQDQLTEIINRIEEIINS